jgi:Cyclic nucleotide-binding domain/TLC ATP/ADP transporter
MKQLLSRWFNVYEDEIALFLWTALLLFLVRGSGIVLNNYAETAFLKRYGVEYLPIVNMLNAVATFVIMGVMTGMVGRYPGARLLGWLFVFCGATVTTIWALIPYGFDFLYPLLFMLKSQYEVLLALLFWNLANDLFNTRQSKRIFPLVTAGGVVGQILGSFGTPWFTRLLPIDNLLLVYLVITLCGALAVSRMARRFPTLLFTEKNKSGTQKRTSMIGEFRNIRPLLKESKLIWLLILLTFVPNVVIPIMNYQFNFAVNEQFATESGMLQFFGYFRGVLNIISLVILLFVGRIYGRFGLPVALMFHPFNYLLVFFSFLLRFDAITAMYARMSANIVRTTINIPAMAVLQGLFPESYRAIVRPFLRGTVVRIALFLGSGLILISEPFFHPRYLSLVAIPFVLVWVVTPFVLKRKYADILLDLISRNMLDLKAMDSEDVGHMFKDKSVKSRLVQAFLKAEGEDCLWYARLLQSLDITELDGYILEKLAQEKDDATRIGLLGLMSTIEGDRAGPVFRQMVDPAKPQLARALIQTAGRIAPQHFTGLFQTLYDTAADTEVKARAAGHLYPHSPDVYHPVISGWLDSPDTTERAAGVIAAGRTGDTAFVEHLESMLNPEQNDALVAELLRSLHQLAVDNLNQRVAPYLDHPSETVRIAALDTYRIENDDSLREVIALLGDPSDVVHRKARQKIHTAPFHHNEVLVESLISPKRRMREGIFHLIDAMGIKGIDTYRFARSQIQASYEYLDEIQNINILPDTPTRDLLEQHLREQAMMRVENTLRVLAAQDGSGQMIVIWRGIVSADSRQRGNSVEALEDLLNPALTKIIIPLVDDSPTEKILVAGRKYFNLPQYEHVPVTLYQQLLAADDWVTTVLTLDLLAKEQGNPVDRDKIVALMQTGNRHVCQLGQCTLAGLPGAPAMEESEMTTQMTIPEKIIHIKGIDIFEGLSVGELAAVASITEEQDRPPGEIVIQEGDVGETLFLMIQGEVSVIKGFDSEKEFVLDRIQSDDYFGEMALFEDEKRSATIRTEKPSRFLILHKQEFKEIVREYPQIALHACKVLSGRLRKLQGRLTEECLE